MTIGFISPPITFQGFTNNGAVNAGGSVYTYAAGTTTPIATYTDSTLGTPNTNPVKLNAIGQAPIWLTPNVAYKFVETDALGNQCGYVDQILGQQILGQASVGQLLWPQTQAEITAGVVPTYYYYQPLDVRRYGAIGNNVADDTAALQAGINVAIAGGNGVVLLPLGSFKTSANLNVGSASNVYLQGESSSGSSINPSSGVTAALVFNGGSYCGFSNLAINCANAPSATAASITGINGFVADNFQILGANVGLYIYDGITHYYTRFEINGTTGYDIQLTGPGEGGNDRYFDHGVCSNANQYQPSVGILIQSSGGDWFTNMDVISKGVGLSVQPGNGQQVNWLFANNCAFDTCSLSGISIVPTGTGTCYGLDFTACWSASHSAYGVYLGSLGAAGSISGVRFNGLRCLNNQQYGINFAPGTGSAINTSISNCDISGNGAPIPPWSSTTLYSPGNLASLSGTIYECIANCTNNSPPNATYWEVFTPLAWEGIQIGANVSSFSIIGNRIGAEAGFSASQYDGIVVAA
jgi:hypothetical protein